MGYIFWGNVGSTNIILSSSLTLHVKFFQVYATSSSLQGVEFFSRCYVWKIISSLALWIIWKARCSKINNVKQTNVVDQVNSFLELLVNTIKGVPKYIMLNKLMLWIRLSLSRNYW